MSCLPTTSPVTFVMLDEDEVRVVRETGVFGDLDFGVDAVDSVDFDGVTVDDRRLRFLQVEQKFASETLVRHHQLVYVSLSALAISIYYVQVSSFFL